MDVINAKSNTYPFVEVVIYSEILRTNCRMNQSSSHLATKTGSTVCEGVFGSIASTQLSDEWNGEAQIDLLHVITKHMWYIVKTHCEKMQNCCHIYVYIWTP